MARSIRVLASFVLPAALAFAGCGGDDDDGGTITPTGSPTDSPDPSGTPGVTPTGTPAPTGSTPAPSVTPTPSATPSPEPTAGELTSVDLGGTFAAGTRIRDFYTGYETTVNDDGTAMMLDRGVNDVLLIEEAESTPAAFSWDNATVYFVMTDRFENGDPSNDNSYGRAGDGGEEVGTWHGGDLRGLTDRLDYIEDLGANAIWITAFYEQIHGFVGLGAGEARHFAYHGYWPLDFTKVDANLGTEEDLRTFIDSAHERGIRVVLDVVVNHAGYPALGDLVKFGVDVVKDGWSVDWEPGPGQSYHDSFDTELWIDRRDPDWLNWWGTDWIRIDNLGPVGGSAYQACGSGNDPLRQCLAFLPDFLTESQRSVGLPVFYQNKPDTNAVAMENFRVRDYLKKWLTDWVREYGIDGFRADTAKHVTLDVWDELKTEATAALAEWKAANPDKALDDLPFWMTGEVFGQNPEKNGYFQNGFDSLINFQFQARARNMIGNFDDIDSTYASYAGLFNDDPDFNMLSYISSHDTSLYFDVTNGDMEKQRRVGTLMLMLPGAVQIFYGDETARPFGPTASDPQQGTRSDMNWDNYDADLLAHWQKLGQFRDKHIAIGAGSHTRLSTGQYAFARAYDKDGVTDKAVVVYLR